MAKDNKANKTVDIKKAAAKKGKGSKKTAGIKLSPNQKSFVLLICIIVIAGAVYIILRNNSIFELGQSQAKFSQEYSMGVKTDFYVVGKKIYYCSKDGMALLNGSGSTDWTDTFSMNSPIMLNDGEYAAVADKNNKLLNVYNTEGKQYSITSEGNITTFAVNPIGYSAMVCQNTAQNDYIVNVYNSAGELAFIGSFTAEDGIPIAVDLSDDGKRFAISFLDISGLNIASNVLFYYTDKEEAKSADNSDGMFCANKYEDNIVNILHFMPDGSCVAVSDKMLTDIGGGNTKTYVQNWRVDFENYVTAVDFLDNKYIAVAYGSPTAVNADNDKTNTLHWYNYQNGRETGNYKLEQAADKLFSDYNASIVCMDKTFVAVDIRGKELWRYTALQTVNTMRFYSKINKVIIATANKMSLYTIKNGAEMVEANEDESAAEAATEAAAEATTQAAAETSAQAATQAAAAASGG